MWGHTSITSIQGRVIEEKNSNFCDKVERRVSSGMRSGGAHSASPRTIGLLGGNTGELF